MRLLVGTVVLIIALAFFSANDASAFTLICLSPKEADVFITKTASPGSLPVGMPLTYTIIVTNGGPDGAVMPFMTDLLPATTTFQSLTAPAGATCTTPPKGHTGTVTCVGAGLAASASASFTIVVKTKAEGMITNEASAGSLCPDPDATNNLAMASTTVSSPPGVPTLSEWSRIMMVLVLVAVALLELRRRARLTG